MPGARTCTYGERGPDPGHPLSGPPARQAGWHVRRRNRGLPLPAGRAPWTNRRTPPVRPTIEGEGMEPLRIGILGAARLSGRAIVEPAKLTGARLVAVAARDARRAEAFAAEPG